MEIPYGPADSYAGGSLLYAFVSYAKHFSRQAFSITKHNSIVSSIRMCFIWAIQVQEYYESSESEEEDTTISIVERAQSRLTPVQVTPNHPKPTRRRASLPLARTQPPYIAKGRRARLM